MPLEGRAGAAPQCKQPYRYSGNRARTMRVIPVLLATMRCRCGGSMCLLVVNAHVCCHFGSSSRAWPANKHTTVKAHPPTTNTSPFEMLVLARGRMRFSSNSCHSQYGHQYHVNVTVVATNIAAASFESGHSKASQRQQASSGPSWLGACIDDKVSLVKVKLHNSMHSVLVR
mgnify:CR=1 FL=1